MRKYFFWRHFLMSKVQPVQETEFQEYLQILTMTDRSLVIRNHKILRGCIKSQLFSLKYCEQ